MANEAVVDQIQAAISSASESIAVYALRIIGNIVAVKGEYISTFCKRNILDRLTMKLSSSNG